jgi:hypothetical protein
MALLIPFILASASLGQSITYDDFKAVLPLLQKENFKTAFKKTNLLLASTINDSSEFRAIITYMNIFSAAGMVTVGQMTHAAFLKNASQYLGQQLIMAAYPCMDSITAAFNTLTFIMKDGEVQGSLAASNKTNTAILCFEEFKYTTPVNPAGLIGKTVRCGGTLSRIEVNPNNSRGWIARLLINKAFIRVITPL